MKEITGRAQAQSHMTDILFTLALFCVFAASALLVVVIGARVYENTTSSMDRNFDMRTSISYVTTKIRQNDSQGAVYLDTLGGVDALVLEQTYDEAVYQTWIYHYDGMLRELFVEKGYEFSPRDGQGILEVADFAVVQEGEGLYRLSSLDDRGIRTEMLVGVRC